MKPNRDHLSLEKESWTQRAKRLREVTRGGALLTVSYHKTLGEKNQCWKHLNSRPPSASIRNLIKRAGRNLWQADHYAGEWRWYIDVEEVIRKEST